MGPVRKPDLRKILSVQAGFDDFAQQFGPFQMRLKFDIFQCEDSPAVDVLFGQNYLFEVAEFLFVDRSLPEK